MEVFQEDYRLRTSACTCKRQRTSDAIAETIGWRPKADDGAVYSIAPGGGDSYRVTAISPEGTRVCMVTAGKNPLLNTPATFTAPPKGAILPALPSAGIAQTAERLIRNQ